MTQPGKSSLTQLEQMHDEGKLSDAEYETLREAIAAGDASTDAASCGATTAHWFKVLSSPAPRVIDAKLLAAAKSPIPGFIGLLGWLQIGLFVILVAANGVLEFSVGYPVIRGMLWPLFLLPIAAGGMIGWSISAKLRCRKILATGSLVKGKVTTVSPLPARINGRTFFRVCVEFQDEDGSVVMAKDTVDNYAVDYFLNARDQGEDVDVLYAPSVQGGGRVILPMKISVSKRFD